MRRKIKCDTCKQESAQRVFDVRFYNCVCGEWNSNQINKLLALRMSELGFSWFKFAEEIDELQKRGSAKDQLFQDD